MAAGGGSGRSASSGGLESSLDRRFQGVTNTMESIQSLSGWCIENKKYHTLIVRYWMKWLKKSEASHRLNLFYLANDVIQNCKRKNAIIYRSSFADVLPEAALLVRDPSVRKSVERIFTIWEERNVYPEELISELKVGLGKKEAQIAVNPKAVLKSKIVAEFAPQTFIDQLAAYKRSVEDIELKEKQLSSMRVDVCSTETLKRLKDKAGGKKFSKDFEDGSAKLEEFVSFLDKQVKHGPRIIEALENADIFYEAQYKEVKIVANAYKTFANRVNNLKKKLDQLKTSLPDPEESPIPSPSMDAPSPTGSESPFHGMDDSEPSVRAEEKEVDEAAAGDLSSKSSSPKPTEDNCDVEDMELSDDEGNESSHIIVEARKEKSESTCVTTGSPVVKPVETISKSAAQPAVQSPAKTPGNPLPFAFNPLPNLANVDLGKISSILSSLTSVMKNTGVSPVSRPSPGTPTTPKDLTSGLKTSTQAPATSSANSLASILSKVDISPESILSVLSKTQAQTGTGLQGLSSLLQSVAGNSSFQSNTHTVTPSSTKESCVPSTSALGPAQSLTASRNLEGFHSNSPASEVSSTSANKLPAAQSLGVSGSGSKHTQQANCSSSYLGKEGKEQPAEQEQESSLSSASSPTSLELKIHKFLQVNPSFNALNLNIPILGSSINNPVSESQSSNSDYHHSQHRIPTSTSVDNVDGTPVRDERGSTPTQDEIMDKPSASGSMVDPMSLLSKILSPGSSSTPSSTRSPLQGRESSYLADMKQNSSSAASTTTTASSYRPFKQGELSPTSYRGQSDGWEKPSSLTNPDSSPSEKFYPDTSFQDDDDYHTSGYAYGGPPPSALFNLDKKPSKSILKLSNKTQQTFSEVKDYTKKPPPALVGDNFNRDTEGKFSQHQELGNYNSNTMNSRPSPPRVVHSHGFGRSSEVVASEETPSPKPGESNFFTSSANHNKHFGSASKLQQYVDSSPLSASGSHMVSGVGVGSSSSRTDLTQQITLSAPVSATSTIEFKNMLKNASSSRKSSDGDFPGHHHLGAPDRDRENRNSTTVTEGDVGAGFNSDQQQIEEEHYRIETLVSSSSSDHLPDSTVGKGAPIETLGYSNRRMSGERIQTVESIRVIGKGVRGHSRDALAPPRGTAGWFEGGDHYHDGTGASLTSGISSDLPGSTIGLGSPAAPPTPLSSAATSLPSAPHSSNQPLSLSNFGNQYDDRRSLTLQPPPFPEASVPSFFSKTHPPPPIPQPPPPPSSLDFVVSKQGNPNSKGPGGIMGIVDHSLSFPPRDPIMTLGGNTATIGGVNVVPPSPNSFPPPLTAAQDGLPPPTSLPPPPLLNPSLPPLLGDHGPLSATLPPFKDHCGPAPQPGTVKEHFGPLSGLPPPPDARDLVAGGSGPPNKDLPPHHHQSGGPTPIQGHVQKNLSGGGPPSLSNPLSPPASNSVSASSQKQTSNATSLCHDLHGVAHNLPPPPQGPGQHPIPPPPSQLQQDHGIRPLLPPLPHKPMAPLYPSPHPPQMPMGPFFRPPRPDFRPREHHFNARESFRGAKRPRMSYGSGDRGGGGNPFFAPRRPFFPPRY